MEARTCENFYPRPRVEGDCFLAPLVHNKRDFYPRPRVEGDDKQLIWVGDRNISTHALA